MKEFISNLKARHKDKQIFTHSVQTGYFLTMSLFLLMIIIGMLAINIGYDRAKVSLADKLDQIHIEQIMDENQFLSLIVESKEVSGLLIKAVTYLTETEKKLEKSIKFGAFQIGFFILLFFLILILAPSKFKTSLNANEKKSKKNIGVDILTRMVSSILMTILLAGNIVIQFLSLGTSTKWGIQLLINMILLLLVYFLLLDGKKSFKRILVSSLIASGVISLTFDLLLILTAVIGGNSPVLSFVTYTILFMMSLIIMVYIMIVSKEMGFSLFKNRDKL